MAPTRNHRPLEVADFPRVARGLAPNSTVSVCLGRRRRLRLLGELLGASATAPAATLPPAFSIGFLRALGTRRWPETELLVTLPPRDDLRAARPSGTRPLFDAPRSMASPHLGEVARAHLDRLHDVTRGTPLGRRRCSGIWPPSKPPCGTPHAILALVAASAVFPSPSDPRPTRRRFFLPRAVLMSSVPSLIPRLHQVSHRLSFRARPAFDDSTVWLGALAPGPSPTRGSCLVL